MLFTARTNYFQARQQEDEAQRDVRLAKDRDYHAVVRFVVIVVVVVAVVDTRAMVTVIDN